MIYWDARFPNDASRKGSISHLTLSETLDFGPFGGAKASASAQPNALSLKAS